MILLAGLGVLPCAAQLPDRLVYQGYLSTNDTSNGTVPLGNSGPANYEMIFRIYKHQTSISPSEVLWAESQTVTVDKGSFSVILGNGAPLTSGLGNNLHGSLSSSFSGAKGTALYIGMTVDQIATGEITPRLQFLPSPMAFLAQRANSLVKPDGTDGATLDATGTLTASTFSGAFSGSGVDLKDINAANITSGKIANDRISNELPASKLAGNGTLPDAVLSDQVPRRGAVNTFTEKNTYEQQIAAKGGMTSSGDVLLTGSGSVKVKGTGTISGPGTIPLNGIIMWSGAFKDIPDGWALCDGNNGTPDLRGRFILGASTAADVGGTGGGATATLATRHLPPHHHTYDDYVLPVREGAIGGKETHGWSKAHPTAGIGPSSVDDNNDVVFYRNDVPTSDTGDGASFSILPPYYTLAFIMRVK